MLAGCTTPDGERGLYVYMDEQGNLVSGEVERPVTRSRPDAPAAPEADEAALEAVREELTLWDRLEERFLGPDRTDLRAALENLTDRH